MGVVVGGPVGVTLVLEYYPDAHLPEYLRARSLAPAQVEGGRGHDSQTIRYRMQCNRAKSTFNYN